MESQVYKVRLTDSDPELLRRLASRFGGEVVPTDNAEEPWLWTADYSSREEFERTRKSLIGILALAGLAAAVQQVEGR